MFKVERMDTRVISRSRIKVLNGLH